MNDELQTALRELNEERKKVSVLEQKLRLYENDGTIGGYYALNRIVNQQTDFLNKFSLDAEIGGDPKLDKKYDRAEKIWDKFGGLIRELDTLRVELKITGSEDRDVKKVSFTAGIAERRY